MDKKQENKSRSETRRHVSLEGLAELCIEPPIEDDYDFGDIFRDIQNDRLYAALHKLKAKQNELVHKVFFERILLKDIAKEEKVSRAAISLRLGAILEQLQLTW